jgi:hypothetical protein
MTDTQADPNEQWVNQETGEILTPDAVSPEGASGAPVPAVPAVPDAVDVAIDQAAGQVLAGPGFASRDEFMLMCLKARMISMSDLAPKELRGKPYNCLMVLWKGRALGIDEATAVEDIYVIEGKTSVAPRLQAGLVQSRRLGDVLPHPENTKVWAAAIPVGPDGTVLGEPVEFDWDDALDAELVDPACGPDPDRPGRIKHHVRRVQRGTKTYQGCLCKDNYRKYGGDMLYARALAKCVRQYFPQVGIGVYQPDELGAVTDAEGNPIDVTTVELPPGFVDEEAEKEAEKEERRSDAQQRAEAPADAGERQELRDRIARLPESIRKRLLEAWDADDCNVKGFSLRDGGERPVLPATKLRIAKALVNAWEGTARKEGWDPDAPPAPETAAQQPQEAAEAPAGGDVPAEASGAQSDEDSGQDEDASGDGLPAQPEFHDENPEDEQTEGDEEPAHERKDGAPEPDWAFQLRSLADRVTKACEGVPDAVIKRIVQQVKELHWAKVNEELDEAGVPRDGAPIDLRRMHVSLLRLRAFRASQGMDDVTAEGQPENPVTAPRGETPF